MSPCADPQEALNTCLRVIMARDQMCHTSRKVKLSAYPTVECVLVSCSCLAVDLRWAQVPTVVIGSILALAQAVMC